jgi:hypothetical protein
MFDECMRKIEIVVFHLQPSSRKNLSVIDQSLCNWIRQSIYIRVGMIHEE